MVQCDEEAQLVVTLRRAAQLAAEEHQAEVHHDDGLLVEQPVF